MRSLTKGLIVALLPLAIVGCKTGGANETTAANATDNLAADSSAGPMNDDAAMTDGNATDHGIGVTDHGPGVTDHAPGVTDHAPGVTDHAPGVTDHAPDSSGH